MIKMVHLTEKKRKQRELKLNGIVVPWYEIFRSINSNDKVNDDGLLQHEY